MKSSFEKQIQIRFSQIDSAGILFFSRIQEICHGVFEDFLSESEIDWNLWFRSNEIAAPIKKSETEYFLPLLGGQSYRVQMSIPTIGEHSFVTQYEVFSEQKMHCVTKLVHVFINPTTHQKIKIPTNFVSVIKP